MSAPPLNSHRAPLPNLAEPVSDALGILLDVDEFSPLSQVAIDWLRRRGVAVGDIASPWAVRAARVLFQPGGRYTPNGLGSFGYLFGVVGDRGLIDAAAWSPSSGQIGTRMGVGAALGQGQLGIDGIGTTGRPLPVWRDPLDWLRAGRRGVVIADSAVAAHLFAGAILQAEDKTHAAEVSDALRLPPPTVIFPDAKDCSMTALVSPDPGELPELQRFNGADPTPLFPEALRSLPLDEFLKLDVKPRAQLLAPVLPEKGLAMLYAPRGMGKTLLALGMAYAVASGGTLLRWQAPAPRRVLFIDGEMPLATIQERLSSIITGTAKQPAPEDFQILAADYFRDGLPNLATPAGQAAIEPLLEGVALVVIDNVSTLATIGRDNDAESWTPVQGWLLKLRRLGISVLIVHHAGKGGQQRGTSRREDVLDTSIALRRPSDYKPDRRGTVRGSH